MNKMMRSFRSEYVEDALLVYTRDNHRPGTLFGCRMSSDSELAGRGSLYLCCCDPFPELEKARVGQSVRTCRPRRHQVLQLGLQFCPEAVESIRSGIHQFSTLF